jgi:DNA-binding CsgD family transcriptional regulator
MHVSLETLNRAAQFVDSLADLNDPDRAAEFLLPRLTTLIGCDIATCQKINPEPHVGDYTDFPSGSLHPAAVEVYRAYLAEHPLVIHLQAGGRGPAKISELVTRQGFRRLRIYSEYFRHVPVDDQLAFSVPGTRDGEVIGIVLSRSHREFGEEDSAVLSSVKAPLSNALRRSATRHRARAAVDAKADGLADLTGREMQVLELAAAGRTNLSIARAIDVSPRTIAKHLEHVYRKLGVTSRAAAVAQTIGAADPRQAALGVRTVDRHDRGCVHMDVSLDTLDRAMQLIDSLADLDQPDRPDKVAEIALPGLAALVGSDIITYNGIPSAQDQSAYYTEYPAQSVDPAALTAFEAHLDEHPLLNHFRVMGDGQPVKISDFLDRQEFHRLGLYSEFFRHIPVEHQIAFTLPPENDGRVEGIALNRARTDFTETDRALLGIMAGQLGKTLRRARRRHRARTALAPAHDDGLADLTDRELQVLQQAAQGRTNLAIARAIDVSPRTIAKHLEHIYRKLGVTGRAAAVYRAVGAAGPGQVALVAGRPVLVDRAGTPPAVQRPGRLVSEQPRPRTRRLRGQFPHGRAGRLGDRLGVNLLLRLRRALQAVGRVEPEVGPERPRIVVGCIGPQVDRRLQQRDLVVPGLHGAQPALVRAHDQRHAPRQERGQEHRVDRAHHRQAEPQPRAGERLQRGRPLVAVHDVDPVLPGQLGQLGGHVPGRAQVRARVQQRMRQPRLHGHRPAARGGWPAGHRGRLPGRRGYFDRIELRVVRFHRM